VIRRWWHRLGGWLARALRRVTRRPSVAALPAATSPAAAPSLQELYPPVPEEVITELFAARRAMLGGAVIGAGAVVAGAGLITLGGTASAAPEPAPGHTPATPGMKRKHRWGMAIDLDKCTACGSCTTACREENNIPVLGPGDGNNGARPEWMSMLWRDSESPGGLPEILPFPCQHCEDAPCTKACPVGATFQDSEGIVAQIYDRCIGCRYCMVACPYSRRSFNWSEPEWDGNLVQLLNPDVATRPMGVVEKCTFCHHRIQRAKETAAMEDREPTDAELHRLTACSAACPSNAITFGDLLDPNSEVTRLHESPRGFRLLEHLGTKPAVVYLKRDRKT